MATRRKRQRALVRPLTVAAFGGNALWEAGDHGYMEEQWKRAESAAEWLAEVVARGNDLLIVHGNGPQVGQVLIQMEEAATKVPPGTLDVAVAQTEGSMGYLLQLALRNRLREIGSEREVSTLLTLVVVDGEDAGFESPTKPVGPFFSSYRASVLKRQLGWEMVEDAGRGWRKVVASPRPVEIIELGIVRELLAQGTVVIAGGGGGIPVVREESGAMRGVEAVIDKDRTAAMMACDLLADRFVNLTGVPQVMKNFGKKTQAGLSRLTVTQATRLFEAGQFPAGSMGPKIEAALDFVRETGNRAYITDIENLRRTLENKAGTRIVPDRAKRAAQPTRRKKKSA
jgi:carbamate kinase